LRFYGIDFVAHELGVDPSSLQPWSLRICSITLWSPGGILQCLELPLRENVVLLGRLGFQGFRTFLEWLQVMELPHTAHPARGHEDPSLLQLV
jgi:hypothetical protein